MIASLRGRLLPSTPGQAIVECNGVGYLVTISMNTFAALPDAGHEVSLLIHTHVREDQLALFGFADATEKLMFEKLLSVNGVGPKLAIGILGGMRTLELAAAIRGGDTVRLTRMPGVGKKTAERMVLELKDKLKEFADLPAARPRHALADDVLSALVNLGYQPLVAEKALEKLGARALKTFEELFRAALGEISH
jgi:Holliday junction DNA helicase RuvA